MSNKVICDWCGSLNDSRSHFWQVHKLWVLHSPIEGEFCKEDCFIEWFIDRFRKKFMKKLKESEY